MSLLRVEETWPGSPQAAVFEVRCFGEANANKAACAEAKALGYRVPSRSTSASGTSSSACARRRVPA